MDQTTFNGMRQTDDFLEHFGILGMHWGRRKSKNGSSGIVSSIKGHISAHKAKQESSRSEDENTKRQLQKKKIHQMSNAELEKLNRRLQLEKSYKDLTKADVSPGRKFVTDLLVGAAKQSLSTALNKGASAAVELAISRANPKPQMSWNF